MKITSTPPGATVELDDKVVGVTPYVQDFPSGYFQRPMTSIQKRLEHPVRVRLTLAGYVTQEVVLTIGPKDWLDLHRRSHGSYWLFKSDQFHIDLPPLPPSIQGVSSAGIFLPRGEDVSALALPLALTLASLPQPYLYPAPLLPPVACASIPPIRRADQGFICFSFAPRLPGPR